MHNKKNAVQRQVPKHKHTKNLKKETMKYVPHAVESCSCCVGGFRWFFKQSTNSTKQIPSNRTSHSSHTHKHILHYVGH